VPRSAAADCTTADLAHEQLVGTNERERRPGRDHPSRRRRLSDRDVGSQACHADGSPLSSRSTGSPRPSARCKQPRPRPPPPSPPRQPRAPRPPSPTATPASPATRPPWTPEPTPRPSPNGPDRSKPNAPQHSPAASQARHQPGRRLTEDDIRALIAALGSLLDVIRNAGPAEKAAIYDQLGLKVTFRPGEAKIRAEVTIGPENYVEHAMWGYGSCPRGDLNPHAPFRALAPQASASAYSATRTYARPRYRPGRPPHDSKSCRVRRSSRPAPWPSLLNLLVRRPGHHATWLAGPARAEWQRCDSGAVPPASLWHWCR
jgi:hypothetical protein